MALGIKIKKVEFSKEYTVEELFELIKDHPFEAGKPELTKHGFTTVIVFPPLDRKNQVWISPTKAKACKKYQITKQEQAGVENALANAALDSVTHGVTAWKGMVGSKVKEAERLVEVTAKELADMGL